MTRAYSRTDTAVELPVQGPLVFYTDALVERRDQSIKDGIGRLAGAVGLGSADGASAKIMAAMDIDDVTDDVALLPAPDRPTAVARSSAVPSRGGRPAGQGEPAGSSTRSTRLESLAFPRAIEARPSLNPAGGRPAVARGVGELSPEFVDQVGQEQQFRHPTSGSGDAERLACLLEVLLALDEGSYCGGVDEAHVGQVDDDQVDVDPARCGGEVATEGWTLCRVRLRDIRTRWRG